MSRSARAGRPRPRPGPCWMISSAVAWASLRASSSRARTCVLRPRPSAGGARPAGARSRCGPARSRAGRARGAPRAGARPRAAASRRTCRARGGARGRRRPSRWPAGLGLEDVGLRPRRRGRGCGFARRPRPARRVAARPRRRGGRVWRRPPGPAAEQARAARSEGQDRLPGHGC